MSANVIRKRHLEQGLRTSRNEVLSIASAISEDLDTLQAQCTDLAARVTLLETFVTNTRITVDNSGDICQTN